MNKNNLTKDQCIESLFLRLQRLDKLKKINALSYIVNKEKKLVSEAKAVLAKRGMDVRKFLSSTAGKVAYLLYCTDLDQVDGAVKRCERCAHYWYIDEQDSQRTGCSKEVFTDEDIPIVCTKFKDTGNDFYARLNLALARCSTCSKYSTYLQKAIDQEVEYCSLKKNMFADECKDFRMKGGSDGRTR